MFAAALTRSRSAKSSSERRSSSRSAVSIFFRMSRANASAAATQPFAPSRITCFRRVAVAWGMCTTCCCTTGGASQSLNDECARCGRQSPAALGPGPSKARRARGGELGAPEWSCQRLLRVVFDVSLGGERTLYGRFRTETWLFVGARRVRSSGERWRAVIQELEACSAARDGRGADDDGSRVVWCIRRDRTAPRAGLKTVAADQASESGREAVGDVRSFRFAKSCDSDGRACPRAGGARARRGASEELRYQRHMLGVGRRPRCVRA